MANNRSGQQKDAPESFGAWFLKELKFAIADIRQKVVEEGTYGRTVTPQWQEQDKPQAGQPGGIHGKSDAPEKAADGGVHGKAVDPKPEGPAWPETGKEPAEPKGLGMSYAELTAGWQKAAEPGRDVGREHDIPKQEYAVER